MRKFFLSIIALAVVVIAAYAVYCFGLKKTETTDVKVILAQNDCFVCHSSEPQLPFYASFPVIGTVMGEHVEHAQKFLDLEAATSDIENVSEVTLSMIEHAVAEKTMPIMEYKMIHWGANLSAAEEEVLNEWIKSERLSKYTTGLASEKFASEPICPVPDSVSVDPEKVKLGYKMYYDKRISKDGTIACATCHQLEKGGADSRGTRTSEGIGGQFGGVNAPTVYNADFNVLQFWNGRAADLQLQAAGPPANPVEMGDQTWDEIAARLSQDKELVKEFKNLYPEDGLTPETVTDAIAEFEKTLLTPDSKFDQYLKGNEEALSETEKSGYAAFKANGCIDCHNGTIIGGRSFEYIGIFDNYFANRDSSIVYSADDEGLKGFTGNESDIYKFKVPTLRNVALTAPYFHDGSVATLDEATSKMAHYELGKELDDKVTSEIVAFLETLTGKNKYLAE